MINQDNNDVRWGFVNARLNLHPELTRHWTMVNGERMPIYFARPRAHPIRLWLVLLLAIAILFSTVSHALVLVPVQSKPVAGTQATVQTPGNMTRAQYLAWVKKYMPALYRAMFGQ